MNGAQFLAKVREQSPDTVRMILSGQSDLQATIAAVNEGHIYRFFSKPCPRSNVGRGGRWIRQHRLLTAEKVLLEQTLSGWVKMLIEILGMVSPGASSRASRLQRYVIELASALALPPSWQWGLAAHVSQIGCVALPKDILLKVEAAQSLTEEERRLYEAHPEVAGKLLAAIPRLEDVAAIVTAQFGPMSFADKADDILRWDIRSIGRLLLRSSFEFDRAMTHSSTRAAALEALRNSKIAIPQSVLKAMRELTVASQGFIVREVRLKDLAHGMTLDEDLVSPKGIRLALSGQEVTRTLIVRLVSIADGVGVVEPFRVRMPT